VPNIPMYFFWIIHSIHSILEETIIKETEQNQLTCYGHVQRMAEGRLPKIALKWMPKQKRARGRPKKNWMERIKKAMNKRDKGQWDDRKQWSLGVRQRRRTFWTPYVHTHSFHPTSSSETGSRSCITDNANGRMEGRENYMTFQILRNT